MDGSAEELKLIPDVELLDVKSNPLFLATSMQLAASLHAQDYVLEQINHIKSGQESALQIREITTQESEVGFFLNSMRFRGVPNFSYLFGMFETEVLEWSYDSEASGKKYGIFESIPSTTLADILPTCTFYEWVEYHMQIILSLRAVYQRTDFRHGQLTASNCYLNRKSSDSFLIPYYIPTSSGTDLQIWVLSSGNIVTMEYQASQLDGNILDDFKQHIDSCLELALNQELVSKLQEIQDLLQTKISIDEYIIEIFKMMFDLPDIIIFKQDKRPVLFCCSHELHMFAEQQLSFKALSLFDRVKFHLERSKKITDQAFQDNEIASAQYLLDNFLTPDLIANENEVMSKLLDQLEVDFPFISIPINEEDQDEDFSALLKKFLHRSQKFLTLWNQVSLHIRVINFFQQHETSLQTEFETLVTRFDKRRGYRQELLEHLQRQKQFSDGQSTWYKIVFQLL